MADPMYRQIADDLRLQIETGELRPGEQLRTELELREKYEASRNTVRDAIKWLVTRGLVETRPGQGTFVPERIDPFVTPLSPTATNLETVFGVEGAAYGSEVKAQLRKPEIKIPRVEVQQASAKLTAELELPEGTPVVSRHQQRLIDDRLWSLQTSFYPMSLVEKGAIRLLQAANIEEGAVAYLSDSGTKLVGWRDKIKVRARTRSRPWDSSCPTTVALPSSRPAAPATTCQEHRSSSRSASIRPTATSSWSMSARCPPTPRSGTCPAGPPIFRTARVSGGLVAGKY